MSSDKYCGEMKFFVLPPPPHFYPSSPVLGNGFIARLLHKEFPLKKFNQTRFLGHFRILFSTRMSAIVVVQVLTLFVRHQYQCHTTILRNLTFHPFPVHHGIALCSTIPTRDCISLSPPRASLQTKRPLLRKASNCSPSAF